MQTKKKKKFEGPGGFLEVKTWPGMSRARGQIRLIFGIGLIKIYLIGSLVPVFEKSK